MWRTRMAANVRLLRLSRPWAYGSGGGEGGGTQGARGRRSGRGGLAVVSALRWPPLGGQGRDFDY